LFGCKITDKSSYIIASSGGFMDISHGYLEGKMVAVKTIRALKFGAVVSDDQKRVFFKVRAFSQLIYILNYLDHKAGAW